MIGEGVLLTRTFEKERNAYLGRAIIRGSLCLLLDWTPPMKQWLLKKFSTFFGD